MKGKLEQIKQEFAIYVQQNSKRVFNWFQKYWLNSIAIIAFGSLIYTKNINLNLGAGGVQIATFSVLNKVDNIKYDLENQQQFKASLVALNEDSSTSIHINHSPSNSGSQHTKKPNIEWQDESNIGNTYSNMVYTTGDFATLNTSNELSNKRKKQLKYIKRFERVAKTEQGKYGIPVSITLAQGLLESNVGESRLAVRNNNHFGMKCFSRTCGPGHCSNFTDDSHKDFFRKYNTAWESYRAHSIMLTGKRYRHLLKLEKTDYKNWAKGLKKAGYATDKRYAEKLINLIEDLKLYEYDK